MIDYAKNIEQIVKLKGMTIIELLTKCKIPSASYYKMKKNNKFSTETLEKLSKALNVSVADLVRDPDECQTGDAITDFNEIRKKLDDFEDKHLK